MNNKGRKAIPPPPTWRGQTPTPVVVTRVYLTLLLFWAPLKFGGIITPMEISSFPLTGWEWVFGSFPAWLMPFLAGAGLLLCLVALPSLPPRAGGWGVPGIWLLLTAAALLGLVKTTELDTALLFLWHLLGVFCFCLAVFLLVSNDSSASRWLLGAFVVSNLFAAFSGWQQVVFGGFESTVEYIRSQGQQVNPQLLDRLDQKRAFGTFVYPNSFAAHLALATPLTLLALWRAGKRVEPVLVSQWLFVTAGAIVLGGGLAFSGSRAGILALGGGLTFGVLRLPALRKWRLPAAAAAIAGALLLMVAVNQGRTLSSAGARMDYYRAAVEMFVANPLTGVGLGEFFTHYMKLKPAGAEETRQPHNMFLAFLAQAGVMAGAAAVLVYLLPLFSATLLTRQRFRTDPLLMVAVEAGMVAWLLHSLLDFNVQIPGTLVIFAALPFLAVTETEPAVANERRKTTLWMRAALAVLALTAMTVLARWPGERAYRLFTDHAGNPRLSIGTLAKEAEKAAELLPHSPYPWSILGKVAAARADYSTSAMAYSRATARVPHRSAFHTHHAKALIELGRPDEARTALAAALEWYPLNERNISLAAQLGLTPESSQPVPENKGER